MQFVRESRTHWYDYAFGTTMYIDKHADGYQILVHFKNADGSPSDVSLGTFPDFVSSIARALEIARDPEPVLLK